MVVDLEYGLLWILAIAIYSHTTGKASLTSLRPRNLHIGKHTIYYDQQTQQVQITDQPMAQKERDTRTIGARTRRKQERLRGY